MIIEMMDAELMDAENLGRTDLKLIGDRIPVDLQGHVVQLVRF